MFYIVFYYPIIKYSVLGNKENFKVKTISSNLLLENYLNTKKNIRKNGGNSTGGVQWVDFMLSCTTQAVFNAREKNETFYVTNKTNKQSFIYTSQHS